MRKFLVPLLALACACGGGGGGAVDDPNASAAAGNGAGSEPSTLTALDVLGACVSTDLDDFAGLFGLLGGLLGDGSSDAPLPEPTLDFGMLLTRQKVGWSYDLDRDGSDDVQGTLFFTDGSGAVTVPFSFLDIAGWIANPPENPLDVLAAVPDGHDLHVTWSFDALPMTTSDAAGDGELVLGITDGQPGSASGSASLTTGGCAFDFSFDEITLDPANATLPAAEAAFTAETGDHTVTGKATFDGSTQVRFEATLDDGEPEVFTFEIDQGAAPGAG